MVATSSRTQRRHLKFTELVEATNFIKHRRYAQYTEGIETEAKTKQLEQLIIQE